MKGINRMQSRWSVIPEFPNYSVSDTGFVRNDDSGKLMSGLVNQHNSLIVGITRGHVQYKRAVAPLVASAFLPPPKLETFNTPINLDGDRINCHVDNLMLRPLWFARKYFAQFRFLYPRISNPIEELKSGEWFENSRVAATTHGLLDLEILIATLNHTYVWPTYQRFRIIPQTDTV